MSWKSAAQPTGEGFYLYRTGHGTARIFMPPALFAEAEDTLGIQVANALRFPGVIDVAVTPDAHQGYGVPVGCVMATRGTLAMGPVGYDIGCGMAVLRSEVPREQATPEMARAFSRLVMARVGLGRGARGQSFTRERFEEIVRGGAEALGETRDAAERDRIPVDEDWDIPKDSRAWRGQAQLGSLGGGNHFMSCSTTARACGSCSTRARAASATAWPSTTSRGRGRSSASRRGRWTSASSRRSGVPRRGVRL